MKILPGQRYMIQIMEAEKSSKPPMEVKIGFISLPPPLQLPMVFPMLFIFGMPITVGVRETLTVVVLNYILLRMVEITGPEYLKKIFLQTKVGSMEQLVSTMFMKILFGLQPTKEEFSNLLTKDTIGKYIKLHYPT